MENRLAIWPVMKLISGIHWLLSKMKKDMPISIHRDICDQFGVLENPELRFFMLIKEELLFSLKSGQRRKLGKKEILISAAF